MKTDEDKFFPFRIGVAESMADNHKDRKVLQIGIESAYGVLVLGNMACCVLEGSQIIGNCDHWS